MSLIQAPWQHAIICREPWILEINVLGHDWLKVLLACALILIALSEGPLLLRLFNLAFRFDVFRKADCKNLTQWEVVITTWLHILAQASLRDSLEWLILGGLLRSPFRMEAVDCVLSSRASPGRLVCGHIIAVTCRSSFLDVDDWFVALLRRDFASDVATSFLFLCAWGAMSCIKSITI